MADLPAFNLGDEVEWFSEKRNATNRGVVVKILMPGEYPNMGGIHYSTQKGGRDHVSYCIRGRKIGSRGPERHYWPYVHLLRLREKSTC